MKSSDSIEQLAAERAKRVKALRDEIQRSTGKSTDELFEEREKRARDAIQLREPDRVPVAFLLTNLPARYGQIPMASAYYDVHAWTEAKIKTIVDFEADLSQVFAGNSSGLALEALGAKNTRWPGFNLPPDVPFQAVELENMKEDEYDLFLSDPGDFTVRRLLPRVYGALAPLSRLPALRSLGQGFAGATPLFATPEFGEMALALHKAGQETEKWLAVTRTFNEEIASLGFPPYSNAMGYGGAPFDAISDFYRGMRGAMTDMYRCPDKLIAACDMILKWRLERVALPDAQRRGDPTVPSGMPDRAGENLLYGTAVRGGNPKRSFVALHRGAEGFMSNKQFEKFYWPGLKKSLLKTFEAGIVSMVFFEGIYGSRLEYLLELPRGSIVCHFDQTDMFRAKEILGGHLCIMGNVPPALLQVASVSEVEEYCEKLIKVCGKGGGFILGQGGSLDEAKPANLKAMVDSAKKFRPS